VLRGDQERILVELESRVVEACLESSQTKPLTEVLASSTYHERQRLRTPKQGLHASSQSVFVEIERSIRRASPLMEREMLRRLVRAYGQEIAGHFNPRIYRATTRVVPLGLNLLLNAVSPKRLLDQFPRLPRIDETVRIQGAVDDIQRLQNQGTVILAPTHVSNLDSVVVGYAIYRMGLPPFTYGAGLNLFKNPLLGFFMHNLGAYTVDRTKQDPLYKETLKTYCSLTLEHGYHNLFFPGGTRSRSGAVERHLKLGLLGSGLQAYIRNLQRKAERPKIFIFPMTISTQLVLESESLIQDFLRSNLRERFTLDDDESNRVGRIFQFVEQLLSLDSKIHLTISTPLDPFGNRVDAAGESVDPRGRRIQPENYVMRDGAPTRVFDRDAEYTRELGGRITDAYARDSVIECTHIAARATFVLLCRQNPGVDLNQLLKLSDPDESLALHEVYGETERLMQRLRKLRGDGALRLGPSTVRSVDNLIDKALQHFSTYHSDPALLRRGDRLFVGDRSLLFYYQNRLEGYGLEDEQGIRKPLSADHLSLAEGPLWPA
jgi:glycerol-3-phosphate O-acyltransferase